MQADEENMKSLSAYDKLTRGKRSELRNIAPPLINRSSQYFFLKTYIPVIAQWVMYWPS